MKRTLKFISVLIVALLVSSSVFATPVASGDATMSLVKDEVCNIQFGKYGSFEKKMVNIDTNKKTIDIRLTAKNNQEPKSETVTDTVMNAGEVIYLIDGSKSMLDERTINGVKTTRQQVVINSAKDLTKKLFAANNKIKIGVVEFGTTTTAAQEGGDDDAKIITPTLVNSEADVNKALDALDANKMGPRTNIEVGLNKAQELLSTSNSDAGKYIIVLTDAIPNTAKGIMAGQDGKFYDDNVFTPTKNKLTSLKSSGINVISMLIEMSDDEIDASTKVPKPTYKQVAQSIFGTATNPTAGPVYYVSDNEATKTITESIYSDLTTTTTKTVNGEEYVLTDIVIKDYFPQNIIDNFNFAYLTQPNKGKVSAKVDTSDNSITWTISELKPQESATFTYRLSLKDNFDSSIIAVNLPTNKDVTIDYKENGKQGEQKHNDKCPIVILDVEAKKAIPQTGSNTWLIVAGLVSASVIIAVISFINYRKSNV